MPYILPFFGVILGALIALLIENQKSSGIKLLLAFSGAFLMALSLFDLLPDVYAHLDAKRAGVLIMSGILLQILLEFFSKGAEHGHVHLSSKKQKFPTLLLISLGIHSFLEGFPLHSHENLMYAVLIHKIPIALLLTTYFINLQLSKRVIVTAVLLFALMTPLGTWVSLSILINETLIYSINALIVGIFLHISTTIIFESGDGHKFNLTKLVAIILGIVVAYFL